MLDPQVIVPKKVRVTTSIEICNDSIVKVHAPNLGLILEDYDGRVFKITFEEVTNAE